MQGSIQPRSSPMRSALAVVVIGLLVVVKPTSPAAPVYDGVLRDEGDGLTSAYMVPYSNDNHAVTLEKLPDGTLVAAWFGGKDEEASGTAIVVSRLVNGSKQWTNTTIVAQRNGYANGNPLLFFDSGTGTLHLWHTQVKAEAGEEEAEIYRLKSHDAGSSWSDEGKYFDDSGIYLRNRIVRRSDGKLLWPFYSTGKRSNGKSPAFAWSRGSTVPSKGEGWTMKFMAESDIGAELEQPTCWRQPHDMDTIECYFRDCGGKSIYAAASQDDGEHFSKPKPTSLPNPNSGIEAYPLKSGSIVLIYNPTTRKDGEPKNRNPLSAGLSMDDGKTWVKRDLQNGPTGTPPAGNPGDDQFSYPTVLQGYDGIIHVMYTYAPKNQRRTIKYVRFEESWITKK